MDTKKVAVAVALCAQLIAASTGRAQEAGWWRPTADKRISMHWVLGGPLNTSDLVQMGMKDFNGNTLPEPDVYDIDGEMNSAETVAHLHSKGKKVICYIDAGVYESYRLDAHMFESLAPRIWGNPDEGWNDSYWLDIRRISELEPIMKARMQMCKDKGFDAVEPDEIDGWENDTGFAITYQDQLSYNKALASWAHELGLSIGQKGDIIQTRDLVNDFDWTLNEECFEYKECSNPYDPYLDTEVPGLQLYVMLNKAVFVAEYKTYTAARWAQICTSSANNNFNTTRFRLGLRNNGGRNPCSTVIDW